LRKNQSLPDPAYRGRFAPSPTGPLHFGSLVAAVGSYLDAKHHHGKWLVRIEDLDIPRAVKGSADEILNMLEMYGLQWDEPVIFQSQRTSAYEQAFHHLKEVGAVYPCCCTRKEIADSALYGIDGQIYPGTCRNGTPYKRVGRAWRVRTDKFSPIGSIIGFDDILQGYIEQHLEREIGDYVVKRADGLFAYQLAVVVDDAFQNITHIVRGCDLIASTPRQIYLQCVLSLHTPQYMHLPVAVNARGEKLSKQTLASPVTADNAVVTLIGILTFLRQQPPAELCQGNIDEVLRWAIANWQPNNLRDCRALPAKISPAQPHGQQRRSSPHTA